MTTSRTYRPAVGDRLEDRTVPSGLGLAWGSVIADVPTQDARQVIGEFQTFERSFQSDYHAYLSAVRAGNASTGATTFTSAIGTDIGTLTSAVDATLANLASNNPNLASTVNGELSTLQTELTGLSLPTAAYGRASWQYLNSAFRDINQTMVQVVGQVQTATPPSGSISGATFNQVLRNVESAFGTFMKAYNAAITNSATNPATNRSAFDTAVGSALTTLNGSLSSALSPLPASVASSLSASFTSDLLSSGGSSSLQTRLSNIPSPTSAFFSTWWFRFRSYRAIGISEGQVVHQLISAVHNDNAGLA